MQQPTLIKHRETRIRATPDEPGHILILWTDISLDRVAPGADIPAIEEVEQYAMHEAKEHNDQYDAVDLRTIPGRMFDGGSF